MGARGLCGPRRRAGAPSASAGLPGLPAVPCARTARALSHTTMGVAISHAGSLGAPCSKTTLPRDSPPPLTPWNLQRQRRGLPSPAPLPRPRPCRVSRGCTRSSFALCPLGARRSSTSAICRTGSTSPGPGMQRRRPPLRAGGAATTPIPAGDTLGLTACTGDVAPAFGGVCTGRTTTPTHCSSPSSRLWLVLGRRSATGLGGRTWVCQQQRHRAPPPSEGSGDLAGPL